MTNIGQMYFISHCASKKGEVQSYIPIAGYEGICDVDELSSVASESAILWHPQCNTGADRCDSKLM